MRLSEILTAATVVAPLVSAHDDHIPGMPKIFGLGAGVNARDLAGFRSHRRATQPMNKKHLVDKRQQGGTNGRCGPNGGGASCAAGYCCSAEGWCGNTSAYCAAPDCLIDYGPGCDALKVPNGASTRNIDRPKLGNIAYGGEGIYSCVEPGTIAITYDDGPYIYTNSVLDQFASYNMKATFFVTGNNLGKGAIDDASTPWPAIIQRMVTDGHQVASHTWSHQDLSAITQQQRTDQMVYNEMAIRNIIQKFPTYMRPPYSSCNAACQADLAALGYAIVYFDLDTTDYLNTDPSKIQNAKDVFNNAVGKSNPATDKFLAIAHDIHQQTAQNLTGYMLEMIKSKGYKAVTVGECLGDPAANWYRASSGKTVTSSSATLSSTAPTATPTGVSQDGSCGASVGLGCTGFPEGSCCSQFGFCGSTPDHCGTGCQSAFGTCGSSSNPTSTGGSTAPPSTATGPTAPVNSTPASSKPPAPSSQPASSSQPAPSNPPAPSTTTQPSTPPAPSRPPVSKNGKCGASNGGTTCIGYKNLFGLQECCSLAGTCGSGLLSCGLGCHKKYGKCLL